MGELSKCDFAQKMRGVIVVTEGGTARSGPGKESRVGYFAVDVRLANGVQKFRPREEVAYHPCRLAEVHFAKQPADVRCMALDSPPDVPKCRFSGPR
jgi:hypothetical protein